MSFSKSIIAITSASVVAASALYTYKDAKLTASSNLVESFQSTSTIKDIDYKVPISKGIADLKRISYELGLPGIVVGVSVNGKTVWAEGMGFSNIETQAPCHAKTKMRIASISKPITIALLAKQKEMGLVDLDGSIQQYVNYFPAKVVDGKPVTITPRLLACHKSGVRHYKEVVDSERDGGPEFYLTERFKNVQQSVNIFKDDDLLFSPGDKFHYTTHGYTLLSAVIEGAGKAPFTKLLREHLATLGLHNIHLDEVQTIVYDRASYYTKSKRGALINANLTDNSYKWAGGGLLSNVEDLLKFANIMLYSYQQNSTEKPGYLLSDTVKEMWTAIPGTERSWSKDSGYGLGWTVVPKQPGWMINDDGQPFHVGHGGGAVGASSVLLIFPLESKTSDILPCGVTVAMFTNLQDVSLYKVAKDIAKYFINANQQHSN